MNAPIKTPQVIDTPSPADHSVAAVSAMDVMLNDEAMQRVHTLAQVMATSKVTIPKHLQGSQGDCFAVILQSMQWGMNPFAVAQKTHLVNGTLGYEAQLINAVIITRAPVKGRLEFDWYGDWSKVNGKEDKSSDRGVKVWATLKGEDEPRMLDLSMAQVGPVRNSPMWQADPRQQIAYLAIKRWSRLYCPDVILGVYSPDEFDQPGEKDVTPSDKPVEHKGSAALKDRLKGKKTTTVEHAKQPDFDVKGCIASIKAAQSIEELKAIAKTVPSDLGEPEQTYIKEAYHERGTELAPPKMLPPESIAAIEKELLQAADNEALDTIAETRFSPFTGQMTEADIDRLNAAYDKRLNDLNA